MPAEPVAPAPQPAPPAPAPRRSFARRWARRLLPPLAVLLLLAWFAPAIVAKTELRNRIARAATADLKGTVTVGGASLGWFAPVELTDVTVTDGAGRTLAVVSKVTSERSLFALARNASAPGSFAIEGATVTVVFEKGTTNLETALADYLKADEPASAARPAVGLVLSNVTLELTDADTGKAAHVEGVAGTVAVPAARAEPVAVALTAATGSMRAEAAVGASGSAQLKAEGLALEALAPVLKRAGATFELSGALAADLRVTWGPGTASATGTVSATKFALRDPALKGEALELDRLDLPLDVERAGAVVRVRRFDLTCDVGALAATGTFDPGAPDAMLAQAGVSVRGHVELAKLAGRLPRAFAVRAGTELREGRVELKLTSRATDAGVVWDGEVHASALKAVRAGKPVSWDKPLDVEFTGRYAPGRLPTFDKLVCTSDFLAANARTTPETVQVAANVYLDRLAAELGKFVDLGGAQLGGEAQAELVGRRERDGTFAATGLVELKNFAFTGDTGRGLTEPALKVVLSATGTAPESGPLGLKTASVALSAHGDELNLSLLEPVPDAAKLASGTADLRLTGDLARWKARLGALVRLPAYAVGGTATVTGRAAFGAERLTVDRLTARLTDFRFRGAGLDIAEPKLHATADLALARASGAAVFSKLAIDFAPLSVTNGTLAIDPQKELVVRGEGPCVCDLNRLGLALRLYADPRGPDALHGRGTGPLRFRYAGGTTTFGGTLDVTNFAYGPKDKPVWAEPALRLEADGDYRDAADALTLAVAAAERPGLSLRTKGQLARATTTRDLKFDGTLRYDWDKLTPLVRELVGGGFAATGTGTRAVRLEGQLNPPLPAAAPPLPGGALPLRPPGAPAPGPTVFAALSGAGAIGWESVRAYGFDVGGSELSAKLERGAVTVAPITAPAGGGTLTLAPTLRLDTDPAVATLPKGPIVQKVKLTTQSTAGAIRFALPAIAGSAQADGEFSAGVDEGTRLVLGAPDRSSAKGLILIHTAKLAPGPVVAEVAKVLGAQNPVMTLANETIVPFQVEKGRVHHQNFPIRIGGTTLRTTGSVGFDESLDLVVEVPLPNDLPLLKNNPILLKAVAGKPARIPLKGTLTKPVIDVKAFNEAVIAAARAAAKDASRDALEKELNKLFPNVPGPKGGLPFPFPPPKKP